jgi:protein-S-isoprenylcysteine O-methyltransferase Ste14
MIEKKMSKSERGLGRKDIIFMSAEGLAFIGQIILCFLFYNRAGLNWLLYLGWASLVIAMVLGWRARVAFETRGKARDGESWLHTTALVESGIYAVVRHPMYLSFMLVFLSLAFISRHWLSALLGIASILILYDDMRREEQGNLDKFGDEYRRYMQKVPRMNFVVSLIRLLQRRK